MSWQDEVLCLLGGRSLEEGIPSTVRRQILDNHQTVELDYLMAHTAERASLAVLITRIPILDSSELRTVTQHLLGLLKLPVLEWIWWIDEYTVTKSEYRVQVDFKDHAKNLLVVIRELVTVRKEVIDTFKLEILERAGAFQIDAPWSDQSMVMLGNEIISTFTINDELLVQLVDVLKPKLSNLKNNKVSQAGYKKLSLNNGLKPKLGFNETENQRHRWKTESIDSIALFSLLLHHLEGSKVKDYWWILSPTILNILDDHEGPIKLKGVELLSTLLSKTDDDYLQLTGLADIFYDAISPLLTYLPKLTPTKQSAIIQETTYPVLIQLFSKTPDFKNRLIGLLNSGIYQGINTVRDNFEILPILVNQIIKIIELLETASVKCLPRLLYTLGMIISDPFIYLHQDLFSNTLECLIVTILNGWPRIEGHKYDILGMIVMSFQKDEKSKDVDDKLKVLVELLKRVCNQDELNKDIEELIRNDQSLELLFV